MADEPEAPEPEAGPQSLVPKRLNIASAMVAQVTAINTALVNLGTLQLQYLQCGAYNDSDFAGTSMPQLSAYLTGLMLSTVAPALQTWYTTALPSSGPVPRDIMLQILS